MKLQRHHLVDVLVATVAIGAAGVLGAVTVAAEDPGVDPATEPSALAITAHLPGEYLVLGVIDNDIRYEVNAVDGQGDRYVVTVYRQFDPASLEAHDLDRTVVDGDTVWTGFDDDELQAVYVEPAGDGPVVRVGHQTGGGSSAAASIDDLTAIARSVAADQP